MIVLPVFIFGYQISKEIYDAGAVIVNEVEEQ